MKFCQVCGELGGERVDFTEMKTYGEVDLDETPVVVLTCGHFYTGENLDMLVGMGEVYTVDGTGEYDGLKDISAALAKEVPLCPDCRRPIRQFSTRRYNRVINKAVMDETCKRFLASGQRILEDLETRLHEVEKELASVKHVDAVAGRFKKALQLEKDASALAKNMGEENLSAKRLRDAIITCQRQKAVRSLADRLQELEISPAPRGQGIVSAVDKQVTLKARLVQNQVKELVCRDMLGRRRDDEKNRRTRGIVRGECLPRCAVLAQEAMAATLPRVTVAAILTYARLFMLLGQDGAPGAGEGEKVKSVPWDREELLERLGYAVSLCNDLSGGDGLRKVVEGMTQVVRDKWYEEVTPEEIVAIKAAMVSGSAGLATNSGHWYNCANGHPVSCKNQVPGRGSSSVQDLDTNGMQFAIGECGMPMELAQCPECGAQIGGTDHAPVVGTSRATEME